MPLREGSLTSLAKSPNPTPIHDQLCSDVMEQMLSALDYLANENLIHRDLKPDNILYSKLGENRYLFQLADFGLAHHPSLATTFCGTGYFQAPEFWPGISKVNASQSPKIDVWSLFASIVAVHSRFGDFPPNTSDYSVVLNMLRTKAQALPSLEPMARLHPNHRASAAQMLVLLFKGKGLTTPQSEILPIEPDAPLAAGPSNPPRARNDPGMAPERPAAGRPLIVYPPWRRPPPPGNRSRLPSPAPFPNRGANIAQPAAPQLQPIRAHRAGIVKRRAESRTPKPNTVARIPPEKKVPIPTGPPPAQDPPALTGPHEALYPIPGAFVD